MFRERCSCGAEFETDEEQGLKLLREWRKEHKCMPGDHTPTSGMAQVETAPDATRPELHIGFRVPDWDDE